MIDKKKVPVSNEKLKKGLQRRKILILVAVQIFILFSLIIFLFRGKNNFLQMPRKTIVFTNFLEIMQQLDEEVDECLQKETRKEQNYIFMKMDIIPSITPIKLSEMTAVFNYTGDVTELLAIEEFKKDVERKKDTAVVVKRIILKKENLPEEEAISLKVSHPNVIKTYLSHRSSFTTMNGKKQEILWLFMEPLTNKLVTKVIKGDERVIREILTDTLKGLDYLHSNRIVHLDIKLANIMGVYCEESNRMVYKLIDMGFSREFPKGVTEVFYEKRCYGTFPYKPPEAWLDNIHGYASDIWCLGMTALFLVNMDTTYFHVRNAKSGVNNKNYAKFDKFLAGNITLPINRETSPELADFIKKCIQRDQTKRWTAKELLNHPFIKNQSLPYHEKIEIRSNYYV
ncbi:hypothetical protein NEOKW01_0083 [Nematocida sp. AWRm80]|nr:hypothetical protein NEOKW01_0083 [Nematocida sp. AWRm80]